MSSNYIISVKIEEWLLLPPGCTLNPCTAYHPKKLVRKDGWVIANEYMDFASYLTLTEW